MFVDRTRGAKWRVRAMIVGCKVPEGLRQLRELVLDLR